MSLETEIKNLTKAVETLIAVMQSNVPMTLETTAAPVAAGVQAPVAAVVAPVVAAPVVAAVAMPALPTFQTPAVPSHVVIPFSDTASLVQYTMSKYQQLGQEKGAKIQDVLTALGLSNLSDVTPDHFAAFYTQVEAIA